MKFIENTHRKSLRRVSASSCVDRRIQTLNKRHTLPPGAGSKEHGRWCSMRLCHSRGGLERRYLPRKTWSEVFGQHGSFRWKQDI